MNENASRLLYRTLVLAAVLPAMAISVAEASRSVHLRVPPEVGKGIAAMPPIVESIDAAERKINAALPRLDANVRKAAAECKAEGGQYGSWERSVDVPMRGPRYISYVITDNTYCGGAYPNVSTMAIVYDLESGSPVDWTTLLPPSLTGTVSLLAGADGTKTVTLTSKRLHALYLANYRPAKGTAKEAAGDADCREAVRDTGNDAPAATVWLDAKDGGLAVQFDLPHVVQACADEIVIPAAVLRAEGADASFVEAIEAAHVKWKSP